MKAEDVPAGWVDRIFGLSVATEDQSLISRSLERFEGIFAADEITLLRLAWVFENAAPVLRPYPDTTLNQAFWDISWWVSRIAYDPAIDWQLRVRLIRSFETLFRDFFAVRCLPKLARESETAGLNSVCWMWWDLMRDGRGDTLPSESNATDLEFLKSIRSILAIEHLACQESALHGLGHWRWADSVQAEAAIDKFLAREGATPLRDFALSARRGEVL